MSNWQQSYQEIKISSTTTPTQVLALNTPALNQLGRVNEEMRGVAVFQFAILNLVDYMGAGWTQGQITEAGELAYQEAYWLSLAELKLFITRIKTSYYKSHKNFTPVVFMEFLQEFTSEMYHERGAYYAAQQKKSDWVEPDNPVSDEVVSIAFAKLKHDMMKVESDATIIAKEREELQARIRAYQQTHVSPEAVKEMERMRANIAKLNDDTPVVVDIDRVLQTFKGVKL